MKKLTRSEAREAVFTQVFQSSSHRDTMDEILEILLQEKPGCQQHLGYITEVTNGVLEKETEIVELINANLKDGWTFKRLSKPAGAILKVAVYEIKYCEDIPSRVAINEAVELAKRYCDDKEPSFINGVLGSILRGL